MTPTSTPRRRRLARLLRKRPVARGRGASSSSPRPPRFSSTGEFKLPTPPDTLTHACWKDKTNERETRQVTQKVVKRRRRTNIFTSARDAPGFAASRGSASAIRWLRPHTTWASACAHFSELAHRGTCSSSNSTWQRPWPLRKSPINILYVAVQLAGIALLSLTALGRGKAPPCGFSTRRESTGSSTGC